MKTSVRGRLSDARVMEAEARKRADEDMRQRATNEEARFARERAAAEKRKVGGRGPQGCRRACPPARTEEEAQRRLEKKEDVDGKAPVVVTHPRAHAAGRPVTRGGGGNKRKKSWKSGAKGSGSTEGCRYAQARQADRHQSACRPTTNTMRSVASYRRGICSGSTVLARASPCRGLPDRAKLQSPETITIAELANRMARRAVDVIKVLMKVA